MNQISLLSRCVATFILLCLFYSNGRAGNEFYKERKGNIYLTLRPVFYTPSRINLSAPLPDGVSIDSRMAASYDFRIIYRYNFSQLASVGFGFGFGNKRIKNHIRFSSNSIQKYYSEYESNYDDYSNFPDEIEFGLKFPLFIELRPVIKNQHSLAFRFGVELSKSEKSRYDYSYSYDYSSLPKFTLFEQQITVNPINSLKFESEIGALYEFAFKKSGFLQLGAFFKFPLYNRYAFYQGAFVFFPDTPDETKGTITPSAIAFGFEANYIFSFFRRKETEGSKKIIKKRRRKDMGFHKSLYE